MKSEPWKEIDSLFHAALEREASERAVFLADVCAGDEELRREVESLIASHEPSDSFIDSLAPGLAAEMLASPPDKSTGRTIGPYRILEFLGAGGMGEVYLAEDTRLSRRVALKLLPAQFITEQDRLHRFEREARAASALNHPNIITIHEIGKVDGAHFIVTEFIEGKTLRQQMDAARLRLRDALDVAIQVASALGTAHKAGIVHRDIKPENIMLRPDGLVKVLDFGLAKLAEPQMVGTGDEASTLVRLKTESGFVLGTVSYMSPEQARGQAIDARTDIFSLGVVIYETVAGRPPFEGATTSDMIAAILREEPLPLREHSREVPAELDWVVQKALAKDREERYQTVKELQIDLKRVRQELERQAKPEIALARSQNAAGRPVDYSTRKIPALSSVGEAARANTSDGSVAREIKPLKRSDVLNFRTLLVAFAVIAIFSVVSFYTGVNFGPQQASQPSQPTFRQLTFRRGVISTAMFAPDGQTIIYSAAFDGKPVELFNRRLESPESSSLNRQAGIQSISPSGEMAILLDCELYWGECHNGTLATVPMVGGTPRELQDNVYQANWGPDGKELAIVRVNEEGRYQLEYPRGTVLYKSVGRIEHIRVSPKGDMVAFIDHPVLGDVSGSVMVVDLVAGKKDLAAGKKTLSGGWKTVMRLAWSPTGDEVWFSAGKERVVALHAVTLAGRERLVLQTPGDVGLYDISRDGRVLIGRGIPRSRMIVFTSGFAKEREISWFDWSTSADISADGKTLLFYEWGMAVGGVPFVYLRKMDGSNDPVRLGEGRALSLSPDGKWALALQEGPPPQLVLLPTGAGEQRALPRGEIIEYSYASWFPDGGRILLTGIEEGRGLRSYVQDLSTGQMNAITQEDVIALMVSPDGKRLLTWVGGADGRYHLSPMDGTAPTPIPGLRSGEMPIQWSADGRSIYVRGPSDFDPNIYWVDLATGGRRLWKPIAPDPVGLIGMEVRPGGVKITPDGRFYVYTYWTALQDLFLAEGLK